MKRENDFVYFIKPVGMDGPIKIGCSSLPERRLEQLAEWSPFPLEIIGSIPGKMKDEHFLHCCFANDHLHHEWFRATKTLRATINQILSEGTIDAVRGDLTPVGNLRSFHKRSHPENRRCVSYQMKANWAERKLSARLGRNGAWHRPNDVREILNKWSGHSGLPRETPSSGEIDRLDQYLADPEKFSVIPYWAVPSPKRSRREARAV